MLINFSLLIRLIYPYYNEWAKQVILGNDLLGIILTINEKIIPLHLLFISKQKRVNTNKPDLLLKILKELKGLFAVECSAVKKE